MDEVTQKSSGIATDLATPLTISPVENKCKKLNQLNVTLHCSRKKKYELALVKQKPITLSGVALPSAD